MYLKILFWKGTSIWAKGKDTILREKGSGVLAKSSTSE